MVSEGASPTAPAGPGAPARHPAQDGPPAPTPRSARHGARGAADLPEQGGPGRAGAAGQPAAAPRHRTADTAAELFRRWVDGDAAAGSGLVGLLTPTLWHTARAYRLDHASAEDVVQDAWLALARRRDQLRDPQAVMAWLLVTVRRDAARTAASSRRQADDPAPVLAATPDRAPGPATTVVEQDASHRLWAAVGRLSERCQRLLRVVAFSDRPDYATLSVDLGMPLGSIGPTRGRCLKKLREDLAETGGWTS